MSQTGYLTIGGGGCRAGAAHSARLYDMTPAGAARAQLKESRYADKYRGLHLPIYLVAVEFSKETAT